MKFADSVRMVLERKGARVFSVTPEASVYDALREMADRDIGALLVVRMTSPARQEAISEHVDA